MEDTPQEVQLLCTAERYNLGCTHCARVLAVDSVGQDMPTGAAEVCLAPTALIATAVFECFWRAGAGSLLHAGTAACLAMSGPPGRASRGFRVVL